jgi:hypothetical protein
MEIERATAEQRLSNATLNAEASLINHETAVKNAQAAVKNATAAWDRAVAANEAANEAVVEQAGLNRVHDEIKRICIKNDVEYGNYIKAYTDCMANGMTHVEAYGELQKMLNDELAKRKEAEAKAAEEAEKAAEKAKKEAESGKKKENKSYSSSSVSVSINPNEVGEGVEHAEPVTALSEAGKEISQQTKDAAQKREEMRAENKGMVDYLKGRMKPELAEAFIEKMANKYSYDQLETIYQKALESQLLSTKEQKKQLGLFEEMV